MNENGEGMWQEMYMACRIRQDFQLFEFESLGKKGSIRKRISFIPRERPDVYFLEFGDIASDGSTDFYTVTDNGDRNKILATIAGAIEAYTEKFPERWVYFSGSTKERTRLYRMTIGQNLEQLTKVFAIYSEVDEGTIPFERNIESIGFWVKRRAG